MEVGAHVWLKEGVEWVLATVTQKTPDSMQVTVNSSKQAVTIAVKEDTDELDTIKLCNDELNSNVDNLINLPHLHEPALLYCLQQRYHVGDIYTYTGPILIAVNPFKRLDIYGPDELSSYYNSGLLKAQGIEMPNASPPHVFAIADAAYRGMMAAIESETELGGGLAIQSGHQSILISGESGAGKTESTKIVLRYLTTVGNGSTGLAITAGSVMDKILLSNPILEAFGNAATLRNDNSSRFGKFIQLSFNGRGHLIGGFIETYLLEKVRLPFQQLGQRNFHVFYQMAAGATIEDKTRWCLPDIADIKYASQGQVFKLRNVDDAADYHLLLKALHTLRFSSEVQQDLFQVMAAIVHLGQIEFIADADGEGSEVRTPASAEIAAALLGVEHRLLLQCLTVRSILAMNEVIEKRLKASQASDARDALARHLYSKVFSWVVESINTSIDAGDNSTCRAKIGVLDIFGFECFAINSFEQLCINYTNEALQQQFNHFMFKTEQAEYEREKIDALLIEFSDNQDCLDLIDKKPIGVIAVLDDECRLPKGSDKNFSARLYKLHCSNNSRFSANPTQIRNGEFVISHFAGGVCYNTAQFVDKNRDELPKECTALFAGSVVALLQRVFAAPRPTLKQQRSNSLLLIGGAGSAATQRVTVGSQFREQLAGLLTTIHGTSPHYIRCLKPNDQNVPDNFSRPRCNEQLRYGGVLEAVRVARLGFPVRLSHAEFYSRYQPLANPFSRLFNSLPRMIDDAEESPQEMCVLLLKAISDDAMPTGSEILTSCSAVAEVQTLEASGAVTAAVASRLAAFLAWRGTRSFKDSSVQLGLTKVFFRKHAHDILEGRRSRRLVQASITVQSAYRGYTKWSAFLDMKKAALLIQRVERGMLSRVRTHLFRINKAATKIQACFRSFKSYFDYTRFVMAVIVLQSSFRARLSRRSTFNYWFADKIIRLQQVMLKLMYRRRFLRYRRSIVLIQAACRRRKTRGMLKILKAEARDLGRLQQSNEALKAEIKLIRKQASAESTRAEAIRFAQNEIEASKAKDAEIDILNTEIVYLRAELQEERRERDRLQAHLTKAAKAATAERKQFARDIEEMRNYMGSVSSAELDQLRADLEMALDDLSRETAIRRSLEKEVERLNSGGRSHVRVDSGATSPMLKSSPRSAGKSSIPRYIGGASSPIARTPTRTLYTEQKSTVKATPAPSPAGSSSKSIALATVQKDKFQQQREQVYKEKELTSSTHFMRKESRVQRRKQDLFRAKLKQGVHVYVFDATHNVRKKALLKMDIGSDEMYLCNRLARYSAVPTRMTDIKPVNFTDILECVPGALIDKNILRSMIAADVESILSNQCFLTIVSHNTSSGSRNLILLLETREERNSLLQNVRALTEEVQSKSSANSAPPAPKVPSLGLGPPNVTANFLSPTTASRRKSLSMSSFPPEALQEVEVLDTPRTAKNRHDLFDRASARKVARTIQVRPEEQAAAAPFIRSEENSAVWNPELRSYEQPTRSFLKSAEVASMKLNEISDRNNVSVWRPSGVSSPYLSHRALSARPPLLSQFDDAIGLGRPAMIDTNSPDHSSQIPSSSRSRKYSSSSAGSESESRSPLAKHILQDKIRCSDPTPKNGNSDSEESRNSPASKKDALPMTDALTMTSPVVQGIASTPTPKRRPNLTLQVLDTDAPLAHNIQDEVKGMPPKVPHPPTPSWMAKTPDGGDSTKKFSFKNFLLDEANAALSLPLGSGGTPVRYSAATANQVSPGGRIKQKISNPSPSLLRFLSMSDSAKLLPTVDAPPALPSSTSKSGRFTFDNFETPPVPAATPIAPPVDLVATQLNRAAEIERLRAARLQRQEKVSDSPPLRMISEAVVKEKSAAERLKERLRETDQVSHLAVGKQLEQVHVDKHAISAESHAVEQAKSKEYEEFY